MGYYNVFELAINEGWRSRVCVKGKRLIVEQDALVCPECMRYFSEAVVLHEETLKCPLCEKSIDFSTFP